MGSVPPFLTCFSNPSPFRNSFPCKLDRAAKQRQLSGQRRLARVLTLENGEGTPFTPPGLFPIAAMVETVGGRRRMAQRGRRRLQLAFGIVALAWALAASILLNPDVLASARERVLDAMIGRATPAIMPGPPVIVVDIGEADETGASWDRADMARLVERLAEAGPAVVAFDIVFSGNCGPDAANDALAAAIEKVPAALGFLLSDRASLPPEPRPQIALSGDAARSLWLAPGAEAACLAFGATARGAASISLLGDADATVRRIPAAVAIPDGAYPSLAVEVARLAHGQGVPLIGEGRQPFLKFGSRIYGLENNMQIRFVPSGPQTWKQRTFPAADILAAPSIPDRIAGAIVFIGSSLPQRGGLRPTAASPVHPSVQIHADAAASLLTGRVPYRPAAAPLWEAGFVAVSGLAVAALVFGLPAIPAFGLSALLAAAWAAVSVLLYSSQSVLTDPAFPPLAIILMAFSGSVGQAALIGRAERALRRRMGQLLPASVVSRIAEEPRLLKLEGEAREVTAFFTDIEGFSAMTHKLGPRELVRVLDTYFALTCAIVLKHGGMIDKMVGDSIHALFNAPLDLPDHSEAAIACAKEIVAATEAFRNDGPFAAYGIGPTRIGIETGMAVLGDVGSGSKIDYTAHGNAVNLAARLQDANKDLGTSICIGPAAAVAARTPLRAIGEVEIRSFGRLNLYTLAETPSA
jgi:adenylate cyclase